MILSLVLGIVLGAVTVIFALQNVAVITVTFMTYQVTAPLALVLLATLLSGVLFSILIILPSLIRDTFYIRTMKKEKRALEDELAQYRLAHPVPPNTQTTAVQKETVVV